MVYAYAKAGRCSLRDDPRLPFPIEREAVVRREVALPYGHSDVLWKIDEDVVLAELLKQRAEQDGLVATVRLPRHQDLVRPLQQLKVVGGLALVVSDFARD